MTEPSARVRAPQRRALRQGRARALGLVAVAIGVVALVIALRDGERSWPALGGASKPAAVAAPARAISDLPRSEAAAETLERAVLERFVGPLAGAERAAPNAFLAPGFHAKLDDVRTAQRHDGPVERIDLAPGGATLDASGALDRLVDLVGGWERHERLEVHAERFELDAEDPTAAYARLRLRWAGLRSVTPTAPGARAEPDARVDVRLYVGVRARLLAADGSAEPKWQLEGLELLEGTLLEGTPRFRDVAREVGFTWGESERNRQLGQDFVDQHRTLALGGLSVVDFDRDGFPDVLAARAGEFSVLYRNDGRGGFVPEPLPPVSADERPALFLYVDLDGDEREELVGSRPTGYEGDRAFVGLWTRRSAGGPWEHVPRAFALPNPVGLRRLAIQTIVPFDLEGDGDLDLFFAVYGSSTSRGDDYNTVDATDGADNHLAVNLGGLRFSEESDARGITGTRYTYVATAFDFDADGDTDLFEGNDFGPNVLWRNDGAGRFTADEALGFGGVPAYTMGATLADYDNSGRWSLYVSNMSSPEGMRIVPIAPDLGARMRETVATIARGNMLYTEGAAGAPWTERGVALGVNDAGWAWGCSFFDLDNDGDKDLYVTNGFTSHHDRGKPDFQTHYWRQVVADGRALERRERAVSTLSRAEPSSFNGYERDRLYVNLGAAAGALPDGAYVLGADADHDGRAVAPLDMDGDGDLDLALWTLQGLALLENQSAPQRFVRLNLAARGLTHPPLGAVATVIAGGVTRRDVVKLIDGFQSQVHHELHFGLGAATVIDEVEVRWPDGTRDVWRGLAVDARYDLVQGAPEAAAQALPRWPEATRPQGGAPRPGTLLAGAIGGFDAPFAAGRPLVVRVGGPGHMAWPMLAELEADAGAEGAPGAAPAPEGRVRFARVLAGGAWRGEAAARRSEADLVATRPWLTEGFGATFEPRSSAADAGDVAHAEARGVDVALAIFDARGELLRIFRGEPPLADVRRVLDLAVDEPAFPGLLVEHGRLALSEHRYREAAALFQESLAQLERDPPAWEGLGRAHVLLGRLDLAEQAYASAVRADPDYALGHYNLAVTRTQRGRPSEAIAPLQEALRIEGKLMRNLLALGEAAALAGELELALDAYNDASVGAPTLAEPHVSRGKVLARLGRYDEAEAALERALALEPDNLDARAAVTKVRELRAR
ncbi:MAG: FG-GAP-like repeat-containing protein [Planctomycetota bacterium]